MGMSETKNKESKIIVIIKIIIIIVIIIISYTLVCNLKSNSTMLAWLSYKMAKYWFG